MVKVKRYYDDGSSEIIDIPQNKVIPMSPVGKMRALTLGAGQGVSLGLSDELSGVAGAGIRKLMGDPGKLKDLYGESRGAARQEEEQARTQHPVTYTVGELGGGVATLPFVGELKGITGISKLAGLGGVAGVGTSKADLTKGEVLPLAKDVAVGGGIGALTGVGAKAVGGIAKFGKKVLFPKSEAVPMLEKALEKEAQEHMPVAITHTAKLNETNPLTIINDNIPKELIQKSIDEKTPLINLGGNEIRRLSMSAKLNNTVAEDILVKHAEKELSAQPGKVTEIINKEFGSKSKIQNLDDILQNYHELAKPKYEEAFKVGDLAALESPKLTVTGQAVSAEMPFSDLVKRDDLLKKYIDSARKSAVGRELKELPDTHIMVLDAAKKKIDDAIGVASRTGEREEARALMGLKTELTDKIDSIVPEYKQAREMASTRFKLEEAQDKAAKIIKAESPEAISRILPNLSPAEKDAFIVGLRDQIMREIGRGAKTGRTNIAEKIFGSDENYIVRQNLKATLGEDYNKLMNQINPLVKAGYNASKLLGGSETAQRESYKLPTGIRRYFQNKIGGIITKETNKKWEELARMITDPEFMAQKMSEKRINLPENMPGTVFTPEMPKGE